MSDEQVLVRPKLSIHLFALGESGQNKLKDQWVDSTVSKAVSLFADVQFQVEEGLDTLSTLNDPQLISSAVFFVQYTQDDQDSIEYACTCLKSILSILGKTKPRIYLIGNSKEQNHPGDTKELYGPFKDFSLPFFQVDVTNSVHLTSFFKQTIISPLFHPLNEEDIQKITSTACSNGHVEVLKLLLSIGKDPKPQKWLKSVLKALENKCCTDKDVLSLLTTAELAYNLERQESIQYVLSEVSEHPRGALLILSKFFSPFNQNPQQLLLPEAGLTSLSPSSVAESRFTHISLAYNKLSSIPEELLQLQSLMTLNLSNNCISQLPSILRWNCPKLRELNLSQNRLVDGPTGLFKSVTGRRITIYEGISDESHVLPQRKIIQMTGQNLYPCIHSLISVDLSHNSKLTKVPEWVCVLPHLALLDLRGLPKLIRLANQLGNWESLPIIRLEPEKMVYPPAKVCAQGSQAIVAYLHCQLKGSLHYRHMKVMLLGKKGSGKSTTFNGLLNQKSSLSSSRQQSLDTATYDYRGVVSDGTTIKVTYHLSNFSSQAMDCLVYQCFFIHRCIYLCFWNITEGKKGLENLLSTLKSIHSCLPAARVLLVVTHCDQAPDVSLADLLLWEQQVFKCDNPVNLVDVKYSNSYGLPCISSPIMMNSTSKDDIERLRKEIHGITGYMLGFTSHGMSKEELVPKLYILLQGIIETKGKHLQQQAGIIRYDELIDSFTSVGGDQTVADKKREFNLACEFLQESGVIICQASHQPGISDIFYLNMQWLCDTLARTLSQAQLDGGSICGTIAAHQLDKVILECGVSKQYSQHFREFMEMKKLIMALDMNRSQFFLPFLLLPAPPFEYPRCDLSKNDTLARIYLFQYIPEGLISNLQSQIVRHLHQLGARLLLLSKDEGTSNVTEEIQTSNEGYVGKIKKGKLFIYNRAGYITMKNSRNEVEDVLGIKEKINAISVTNPVNTLQRNSIRQELQSLSKSIDGYSHSFPSTNVSESWISDDTFWQSILWKKGMYVEFLDGTVAWIEGHSSSITIVTQGSELARVKALTFLTNCLETITDEQYINLQKTCASPCPECIKGLTSTKSDPLMLLNEELINPHIEYSVEGPMIDTSSPTHGKGFQIFEEVTLFERSRLLTKLSQPDEILLCPRCNKEPQVDLIAPDIFLADFPPEYQLENDLLSFKRTDDSRLGKGRFAEVFHGTYEDKPVAVKVFLEQKDGLEVAFKNLHLELNILANISNSHILSLVGTLLHPLCIVFPLAPFGSLQDHLQLCQSGFDDQISHKLLYQIAEGIKYLHSLYIIHRDIKPGNILVWSLHPVNGVNVKISDCGLSQFTTPLGLHRQKGTEDYMAPELFTNGRKWSYDEKVDIFSLGLLLYYVVTGKALLPGLIHKSDSYDMNFSLSLGRAITSTMEEQKPRESKSNAATAILESGIHPASRQGCVTMCVAKCMQNLLKDCLWRDPSRRPSAEGVCSHLLLCTGPSTQERIIVQQNFHILHASFVASINSIIAWGGETRDIGNQFMIVYNKIWAAKSISLPLSDSFFSSKNIIHITGDLLFIASHANRKIHSMQLPDFTIHHSVRHQLPANPCCIFTSADMNTVIVGMEGGKIAMYTTNGDKSPLENPPVMSKVLDHPDRRKTSVNCGLIHNNVILCNCGRYLIGLDVNTLEQRFYKPLSDQGTLINGMIKCGGHLWVWFTNTGEIVVCDITSGNRVDSIDLRVCLHENIPHFSDVSVTTVNSSPNSIWVGTNTGHVLAFHPTTFELIVAVRHHNIVDAIVCLDYGVLVIFGRWEYEGETSVMEGFTIWHSHIQ